MLIIDFKQRGWKNRVIGDRKYLIFSNVCLVERMKKWRDGKKKIFVWLRRKKKERIKFEIFINLLSCFYYIEKNFNSLEKTTKKYTRTLLEGWKKEKKKRKNQRRKGEEGQMGKFPSKPLVLSHFLPNLGIHQNHPKWWAWGKNT